MADRTTLNISLPEEMREWIDKVVATGGYGTVSEYFRELVRRDQRRREREKLDDLLVEAMRSGSKEWTPEDRAKMRRDLIERHQRRHGKRAG